MTSSKTASARWVCLVSLSSIVTALAVGVAPSGAAGTPAPAVLSFTGKPTTLPAAGGSSTISAVIKYGATCTLSVTPSVTGLPSSSACSTSYSKKVTLPKNPTGSAKEYTFTFSVKNSTGTTKALNSVTIGVGAAPPPISFNPSTFAFGTQGVDIPTTPKYVTITNNSTTQPQDITGFTISGTDPADFENYQTGNCATEITPGQSCQFAVSFEPQGSGGRSGFLAITDSSWGAGTVVDYKETGTGQFATVSLNPTSLSFGPFGVRDPSQWTTVAVTNSGTVPLKISSIAPEGVNSADFAYNFDENDCTAAFVTPGSTCYFQIQFTPLDAGARSTDIQIIDNTARAATDLPASGTGDWTTSTLSTHALTYTSTTIGSENDEFVTIKNTSSYDLVFGSYTLVGNDTQDFTFDPNPNTTGDCASSNEIVAPGASCQFEVKFIPQGVGTRMATLSVLDNTVNKLSAGVETVTLTGVGAPAP